MSMSSGLVYNKDTTATDPPTHPVESVHLAMQCNVLLDGPMNTTKGHFNTQTHNGPGRVCVLFLRPLICLFLLHSFTSSSCTRVSIKCSFEWTITLWSLLTIASANSFGQMKRSTHKKANVKNIGPRRHKADHGVTFHVEIVSLHLPLYPESKCNTHLTRKSNFHCQI